MPRLTPPALRLLLAVAVLLLVSACDDDRGSEATPSPSPTSEASIEPTGKPTETATAEPASTASPEPTTDPGPAVASEVALVPAFGGQVYDSPVDLLPYPGGGFMLVEQPGRVRLLNADGTVTGVMLEVRDQVVFAGEQGLLSAVLDPGFPERPYLYAYFVIDNPLRSVISRYEVADDAAVPASELRILEVSQPFGNHNGGALRFGPDGMLYLGLGDGGSADDPFGNGQNLGTVLGSIIRIDVSEASIEAPYRVPEDNPFLDGLAPEIWAYGLRNPWRMAFDPASGRLWVGDVGQDRIEEVDIVEAGGNYGWNILEGTECLLDNNCDGSGTIPPVAEYRHVDGACSITGGYVYRGAGVPEISGNYIYADFCSGQLWALPSDLSRPPTQIAGSSSNIAGIGTDAEGELYLLSLDGSILRIESP